MKQPLIIGNWKSNKNEAEVEEWFAHASPSIISSQAEVILCPPFPLLPLCKKLIQQHQLSWKIGAQDVSPLPEGKHTGAVSAKLLGDFVHYVLIGHSERRNEFKETDEMLFEKVKRVKEVGLIPVFFVQDKETPIPEGIGIVAYEPVFAIGTGTPDTPEHAEEVVGYFKTVKKVPTVLYGGSVDEKNVALFMACPSIDGVVPGGASLDPAVFTALINNA
ncbi:MAG TPA: triose-phosphate isomerase family protein [Candidatus Eisenbacteria bacterium]|nr:triose-phosphate isomerase family protein [Candidatus Eisenbacteria bacterium]